MTLPPLPDDLRKRLEAVAERTEKSIDDCLVQAVSDFVESWEDYHRTVEDLQNDNGDRPLLSNAPAEE